MIHRVLASKKAGVIEMRLCAAQAVPTVSNSGTGAWDGRIPDQNRQPIVYPAAVRRRVRSWSGGGGQYEDDEALKEPLLHGIGFKPQQQRPRQMKRRAES